MTHTIQSPSITVAICAYNAASTIERTLQSVLTQTIENFELLVIDDGSTDETAALVTGVAEIDSRIRFLQQRNGGVASARNRAMWLAQAPIVAFLDADDCWTPDHLAVHAAMLDDPRLSVAFGVACFVDSKGKDTGDVSRTAPGPISAHQAFAGNPCTTCSTMVIRRTAFEAIGPFRAGLDHAEDQEWILRGVLMGHLFSCSGQRTTAYATSMNGQSANLQKMYLGFLSVRSTARELDPTFARAFESKAEGSICLYLARRALRLGRGRGDALRFVIRAAICIRDPFNSELAATILALIWLGDVRTLLALRNRFRANRENVLQ